MHPYTRMPIIKVCERVRVCLLNGTFESVGCLLDFGAFPQCLAHAPTVRQQCYSCMSSIKTKYNIQTVAYDGSTLILIRSFLRCSFERLSKWKPMPAEFAYHTHTFHIHFQGRILACVHLCVSAREKEERNIITLRYRSSYCESINVCSVRKYRCPQSTRVAISAISFCCCCCCCCHCCFC